MHYDDNDGILCCLEGKKEIILYPPSDSKYLYPLLTRKWVNSTALNFRYNSYTFIGYIPGLSSGRFLFELTRGEENILKIIGEITEKEQLIKIGAKKSRPNDPISILANTERLRNELGFDLRYNIREGLTDLNTFIMDKKK